MQNAVAFANNDVITIAWSYGKKPDGCLGFAIYRIDDKGTETALPSHAVFKGCLFSTQTTHLTSINLNSAGATKPVLTC